MYLYIKLHEKQTKSNYYRGLELELFECRPCDENEFENIISQYESGVGKYAMRNSSLDTCWLILDDHAKEILNRLTIREKAILNAQI